MIFSVARTRFEFTAKKQLRVSAGAETNLFRGGLGAVLRELGCPIDCRNAQRCPHGRSCSYADWFDPRWEDGPSGYRDAPRPFVLRWSEPSSGEKTLSCLELILFRTDDSSLEMERATQSAIARAVDATDIVVHRIPLIQLPTEGRKECGRLRVRFVTPVELKSHGKVLKEPDFLTLVERTAERIWTLGRLYQGWPKRCEISPVLDALKEVKTVAWKWTCTGWNRRSSRSGQVHTIGGFSGWAEYEGPLGGVVPLLEIGCWTGIGRQTVWGKGQIRIEELAPDR